MAPHRRCSCCSRWRRSQLPSSYQLYLGKARWSRTRRTVGEDVWHKNITVTRSALNTRSLLEPARTSPLQSEQDWSHKNPNPVPTSWRGVYFVEETELDALEGGRSPASSATSLLLRITRLHQEHQLLSLPATSRSRNWIDRSRSSS